MKNTIKSIQLIIIVSLTVFSCSSNDDNTGDADQRNTYINYSVAGNQINGTFNIVVDGLNPNVTVMANVYPESDSPNLKKALIVYLNSGELGVPMSVPARIGLVEILDDQPDFDMTFAFYDQLVELEAKSISVNVKEIEHNDIFVSHIKGTFEGIAVYIHIINGDEVEEPHIVDGEFEYYLPQ